MYMSRRDRIAKSTFMPCHVIGTISYPTLAYIFDSSASMLYLLCSQVATIAPSFSLFMIPVNKQSLFPAWTILKTPPKKHVRNQVSIRYHLFCHTNRCCQKKGKKKARKKNKTKEKEKRKRKKKLKKNSPDTPHPPPPPPTRVSHTYKPNSSWSP